MQPDQKSIDRAAANEKSIMGQLDYSRFKPFVVEHAQAAHFSLLAEDMRESDKLEGNIVGGDWRKALFGTYEHATVAFAVRNPLGEGCMVFGTTEVPHLAASMIWMLQSRSFQKSARTTTRGYGLKLHRGAKMLLQAHFGAGQTVFNFIPKSQTATIRWLKKLPLQFYQSPDSRGSGLWFFGAGENLSRLANSTALWHSYF